MRKTAKIKLEEYVRRKAEDKCERERIKNNLDYHPRHPDDK